MTITTYFDLNGKISKTQVPGGRVRVQTFFHDEKGDPLSPEHASQTQQQFAEQTDVNYIMKLYTKTGDAALLARNQGVYSDVAAIPDLATSLSHVIAAEEAFMTLPAELRKKLDHDPVNFIKYLNDPSNNEEAYKYGLKIKPPTTTDENQRELNANKNVKNSTKSKPPTSTTASSTDEVGD